ncbi:hypothetical protein AJ88_09190 [Mesorhizobium amorphae CCBAU 01583]|nr:hypothetical protein AJ88_09190 [Mesorhizobium amorphae CCBAU 01583]
MGADALIPGGRHLGCGTVADQRRGNRQRRTRLAFLGLGERPAQMQKRRLGLADVGRQVLEAEAWRAWRFRLSIWLSNSPTTSSSRSRFCSAALSRSSASWRRVCRPEMPAASSSRARRAWGFAWISSPMRPCPTIEGERAPVDWSANRSCTSLARASLPLMR